MTMKKGQKRMVGVILAFVVVVYLLGQRKPAETPSTASPSASVSVAAPVEVQSALFAKRRIEKSMRLDAKRVVEFVEVRKDLPKNELPREKLATDFGELAGMVAMEDIEKGEPIVLTRFATPAEISGLAYQIREGYRAVTLRIDKVRGVGGFIQQDDLVDIIGSFSVGGKSLTKCVLQKAKILAVNQSYSITASVRPGAPAASPAASPAAAPSPGDPSVPQRDRIVGGDVTLVTFEVRPDEAERVVVASDNGRLYLSLRNQGDPDVARLEPVDDVDVYVERPKKRPVHKYDVDMIKGLSRASIGVRVEPHVERDVASGLKSALYTAAVEPPVRNITIEDFQTASSR